MSGPASNNNDEFKLGSDRMIQLLYLLLEIKESEKRDKCLDYARELRKSLDHEDGVDTNCN